MILNFTTWYIYRASLATSGMFGQSSVPSACAHRNHTKLENLDTLDLSHNKLSTFIVLRSCDYTDSQYVNVGYLTLLSNLKVYNRVIDIVISSRKQDLLESLSGSNDGKAQV